MKTLKTLLLLPTLLTIQTVFGQTGPHLTLSNDFPSAGDNITVTYDPSGTSVDGKKDIAATVYYLDNKDNPTVDIALNPDGKLLKGEISVPAGAKAFLIKISSDELVDNNNDKGYVYLVYKDKQPVAGAYASTAMVFSGLGNYLAKIKADNRESSELYKKEFALYPQSEKEYQDGYYIQIARNPDYKETITQKISNLEKSTDEKDLMLAMNLLRLTKNAKSADSLNDAIKSRFPGGSTAKNDLRIAFMREKDLHKKDSLFNVYTTEYAETGADKTRITDNLRAQLAGAYLKKYDLDNYHKYEKQLENKSVLSEILNDVAWDWAVAGEHLDEAEKVSKQSLDILDASPNSTSGLQFVSPKQAAAMHQNTYNSFADTYAYILYKENKPKEALKYMQVVYDRTSNEENSSEHYVLILAEDGQYAKALEITEKSIRLGQNSDVLKEELKKDYVKVKGSDAGYDKYLATVENASKNKAREDLAKTMINQPAPAFALKDFDGKLVSLADLKGKVVIVDFWATWCGPCKASFPGMQLAVNKYKNDPNVKFLFVDTWENGDNYLDGVKKFIADNNYTFHVIMDEKGDDGRQSKVVSPFGVTGVPTKFVIDKNGNIRFSYIGYDGSPEKLLDEVSNMVDLASNPDAVVSSQVSLNK